MLPTAAVSGFYFSHSGAQYFATGKVDKEQVADYAKRKGWTLEQAERWLAPVVELLTLFKGLNDETRHQFF